eukprot:m.197170 g.197170  ORF g.197170 m.197170 type:complete len:630 (+) comp18343_c0_seq3:60-1949(+)
MAALAVAALLLLLLSATAHGIGRTGESCSSAVFFGHYRKDFYLPYKEYPEYHQPDPVQGGRIHLTALLASAANLQSVTVNGQEARNLPSGTNLTYFDWARPLFDKSTGVFGLTFHSRNTDWFNDDHPQPLSIKVVFTNGDCFQGSWTPTTSPVFVSWVTPLNASTWLVHVHNNGSRSEQLQGLAFDGRPAHVFPSLPRSLSPAGHVVLSVLVPAPKRRGQLFSVTALTSSRNVSNCGRTPELRFPVEVWPRSSDCALPGINSTTYSELHSHGIDTAFWSSGTFRKCGGGQDLVTYVNSGQLQKNNFFLWVDKDTAAQVPSTAADHVPVAFLADENDGELNHNIRDTLATVQKLQASRPDVLTYQGGKTNRHSGTFAGICDVQGLDFYIGGCAPTIIPVTAALHITASYAYVRNARNNHMPLPAMTYSQLFGGWAWEPSAEEIIAQIGFVLVSGAKGLTLFQSVQDDFDKLRKDWDGSIKDVFLSMVNPTVRQVLRTGDTDALPLISSDTGDPIGKIDSLSTVIRNHEYILLVAVNTDASGYNNLLCHIDLTRHWKFSDHTIKSLRVSATADASFVGILPSHLLEAKHGGLEPATNVNLAVTNDTLEFSDLKFDADLPLRLFVLPYKQLP